ncbi:hypothetical protein TFLX_02084 [Thermoflexales bacterium]|nr:hypothetical protein TFLX_02084 [Thermoflexales bacterium]
MLRLSSFTFRLLAVISAALFCLVLLVNLVLAGSLAGVFTVGRDDDPPSIVSCDMPADCTLRSALWKARDQGGDYTILFTAGIHTITLASPLEITANAITVTAEAGQTVFINANNNGPAFHISGSNVRLNNLYIYGSVTGTSNISITGSAQGVVLSNNHIGVYPSDSGGVTCNVSPNSSSGVFIESSGVISPGNARAWIYGNHISCNKGTPGHGIDILTDKVIVGADTAGTPHVNYVEANRQHGIRIEGPTASENVIRNSVITDNHNGLVITGTAHHNRVLTNTVGDNTNLGVWLNDAYFNEIQANDIYGHNNTGVQVDGGAHQNAIGSSTVSSAGGNRIHNNAREGIYISDANTYSNTVRANWVGVDGGNGRNGVVLENGTHGNLIGDYLTPGEAAAGRNIIIQSGHNGVIVIHGAHDNHVGGNYIGVTISGTNVLSNAASGISLLLGAHDNTIDQNLIGGNGLYGVVIDGATTSTNTLTLNQIGYHSAAGISLPNRLDGLMLRNGTFGNRIGGIGRKNFIGSNLANGICLTNSAQHNSILANDITANFKYGVLFDGVTTTANVISRTAVYLNGLDGIAERNGAVYNIWTEISTYGNVWLGINTQAVDESTHIPHPPTLSITSTQRSTGLISGWASPTSSTLSTKVELYRVARDASGYGEGRTFVGHAYTDSTGDWSITDPAFTGCYVAFATETSSSGTASTEFSRDNCRYIFLPLIVRSS